MSLGLKGQGIKQLGKGAFREKQSQGFSQCNEQPNESFPRGVRWAMPSAMLNSRALM